MIFFFTSLIIDIFNLILLILSFLLLSIFFKGHNLKTIGVPSRLELLSTYCQFNTHMLASDVLKWRGFYMCFLFFKNCVIVHGVAQRVQDGVASSDMAGKGECYNVV